MKLKEIKNTVVHCKTKEEYDRLMQIYEDAGWGWCSGGEKPTEWNAWRYADEDGRCICAKDNFGHGSLKYHREKSKVISLSEFLSEQGLDKPTIEIGKKYRPKDRTQCRTFDSLSGGNPSYIVVTEITRSGSLAYDIFDSSGMKLKNCSHCLGQSDLEPYEEKPEEFKVGDWVEVTEAFADTWNCGEKTFSVGERFAVLNPDRTKGGKGYYKMSIRVGGSEFVLHNKHLAKLRPCSPPEEKREELLPIVATNGLCVGDEFDYPGDIGIKEGRYCVHHIDRGGDVWIGAESDAFKNFPTKQERCVKVKPTSERATISMNGGKPIPIKGLSIEFKPSCRHIPLPIPEALFRPISFPKLHMYVTDVINAARDLALTPMERKYRKLGLKDSQGNLTESGTVLLIDLLFQKFGKDVMDPVVKKLAAKKSDEDDAE